MTKGRAKSGRTRKPPEVGAAARRSEAEIRRKHARYLFPSVFHYYKTPLPLARGRGQEVFGFDGKRYLDFFGGILTISVGHCRPEVVRSIVGQATTLGHVSTLYPTRPIANLAEKLAKITPGKLQRSFFTNSGSEANETAILLAKQATEAREVIALRHGYSGRSSLAVTLTGNTAWKPVEDQVAGVKHALSPYCYRCPLKLSYPSCDIACAKDIDEQIQTSTSGRVAAFLAEPIQGSGGVIVPPPEYFKVAVPIIRKYGGLFIADEVQTGFGRTGDKWFGIEHWGVQPDIMTMAKGIANGMALGATVATPAVAAKWRKLTISTFGGNPLSCAAALATISVIEKQGLVREARRLGDRFQEGLRALEEKYPLIGDVRGKGLMQGIELVRNRKTKEPAPKELALLMELTKKRGLLIGKGGLYGNVVRLAPPLTVTAGEIDEALRLLDKSFGKIRLRKSK